MGSGPKIVLALLATTLVGATARRHVLVAFDGVEQGQWSLRDPDGIEPTRLVCLGDGAPLLQLYHGSATCSRHVLDDSTSNGTVSYVCPGAGHGQTAVTVETSRLFHLHTQGLAHGAPFDVAYEARLVGPCANAGAR